MFLGFIAHFIIFWVRPEALQARLFSVFKLNRISLQEKNLRKRDGEEATESKNAPAPFLLGTRTMYLSPCLGNGRKSYLLAVGSLFYTSLARIKQFSSLPDASFHSRHWHNDSQSSLFPSHYSLFMNSPTSQNLSPGNQYSQCFWGHLQTRGRAAKNLSPQDIHCYLPCPQNSYVEVLNPSTSEYGLIWKEGHYRCNQWRQVRTAVE